MDRALDLLEALARTQPVKVTQLAAITGCTATAAFRLLHTLAARGLAVQEGARGRWRLGGWMAQLAMASEFWVEHRPEPITPLPHAPTAKKS